MTIEVQISLTGFDNAMRRLRLLDRPERLVRGAKFFARKRFEDTGVELIRKNAPWDTGELANSARLTVFETPDSIEGSLVLDVKHARWVVRGTGIYGPQQQPIVPTQRKFMVFYSTKLGGVIRARSVKGQRPNPFLKNVMSILRQRLMTTLPIDIRKDIEIAVKEGA